MPALPGGSLEITLTVPLAKTGFLDYQRNFNLKNKTVNLEFCYFPDSYKNDATSFKTGSNLAFWVYLTITNLELQHTSALFSSFSLKRSTWQNADRFHCVRKSILWEFRFIKVWNNNACSLQRVSSIVENENDWSYDFKYKSKLMKHDIFISI